MFLSGVTGDSLARRSAKGVAFPNSRSWRSRTFAAITCALIVGAFAERIKFSAVLVFIGAVVHLRLRADGAHGVVLGRPRRDHRLEKPRRRDRRAGWLWQKGALDFAGGTVVHINAGVAGLVGAWVIGKRMGYGKEAMPPHNLPLTMIGACMLWVGWFGFNAGSNLEATGVASVAFLNTIVATAACGAHWLLR
jgi:ammonium transporter, Amt family